MPKAKSKAQAGLLGAVAAGKSTKAKGMEPEEAKERLRGAKLKNLPEKVKKPKATGPRMVRA